MPRWKRADTRSQWFQDTYPGDRIDANVLVVHTTEGSNWPSYDGGAVAPNITGRPFRKRVGKRRLLRLRRWEWAVRWRQHFDSNRSARALQNDSGGVETNTLNAFQVELIGTCDATSAKRYGLFYWKDAPDAVLREVAEMMAWLHRVESDFPLKDAAGEFGKPWTDAPGTYGEDAPQRLSFSQWRRTYGCVGHQHVPENSHWDPGAFPIDRTLRFARGEKNDGPGKPKPKKPSRLQTARRLLWEARKYAKNKGWKWRARQIRKGLKVLPKPARKNK